MFEPEKLKATIAAAAHGTARLQQIAAAIAEADEHQEDYWRICFRNDYIQESIFHGDAFKAVIRFPEYLELLDKHPEFESEMAHSVMWTFKNVLENMHEFYQISLAEIEKYFDEFKKRSEYHGDSLRVYYMKKCLLYMPVDKQLAKEAYEKFHKYPRSDNSDCKACEMNFDMECALYFEDEAAALRIAKPILDGEARCGEIPHDTYALLTKYYLYHANLEEALYYGLLCERLITGEPEFLEQMGTLLELYSVIDIEHGWNAFKHALPDFVECRNPSMRLGFSRGAYRLLKKIATQTEFLKNRALQLLPVQNSEKGWRAEEICNYFYSVANDLSVKLDTRNQSSYYQDLLQKELVNPETAQGTAVHADGMQLEESATEAEEKTVKKIAHGITRKENLGFIVAIPECVETAEKIAERITESPEKEFDILSCEPDENNLALSVRYKGAVYEMQFVSLPEDLPPLYARPAKNMEESVLERIMQPDCCHYLFCTEIANQTLPAYHICMQILSLAFPDMLGIVNLLQQKAYPPEWVKFAGKFENAVSPKDAYSVHIFDTEDSDEILIRTSGLCASGMRELELVGANRENFSYFADMLNMVAAQAVCCDMLPDENEIICSFWDETKEYTLTWKTPEHMLPLLPEDSFAASVERENLTGILVLEQTGNSPAIQPVFTDLEQLHYENPMEEFYRKIVLAKETCSVFQNALAQGFEKAAVRLELPICDYGYYDEEEDTSEDAENENEDFDEDEDFDYDIELVWAELNPEASPENAYVAQEFRSLPNCHIGDAVTFTEENIASWVIQQPGVPYAITQEEAYLLL